MFRPTFPEYSRVTGILIFYDEPIDTLVAMVSSLAGVVDHLVAIDGAYMHFPDGEAASDPKQMRIIYDICRGSRIGLTAHVPTQVWAGNEVMKRNYSLKLAEPVTNPNGWYLVLDADCVVTHVAEDWFEKVAQASAEQYAAITVGVKECRPLPPGTIQPDDIWSPHRLMYRAIRGLEYGPAHWELHAPPETEGVNWDCIWCHRHDGQVDAWDASHYLHVEHRFDRPLERKIASQKYYNIRERFSLENPYTGSGLPKVSK